ncbi:MAG: hypothetical protein HETSPECPRED_003058 [Heterodermia speciosa]|uniref:Aminoglycoside phosphotransferase domain-containing protein n=1 Tax=Heterodermia speciosa TaxID=116794 RepID=A0A8H3IFR8_9LECA|nr:MAG: hypothetical protein HETSPECPRED_003058 [Heterodermia speciosa]
MIDQRGLIWEPGLWGSTPKWTIEPSLKAVAEAVYHHLELSSADIADSSIEVFNQGGFNKLYSITCPRGVYIARVTLPVDPVYKTASEVATLHMISRYTSIPVPTVYGYDLSRANPIGFEWMLMNHMPGITLDKAWPGMSWSAKYRLIHRMTDVLSQLFHRTKSNGIGNIYHFADSRVLEASRMLVNEMSPAYLLGQVVSMGFFWDKHIVQDIPRGPFLTSQQWLRSRLLLTQSDANAVLANSCDEDELEDAEVTRDLVSRLTECIPRYFPSEVQDGGSLVCCMHHDDLSWHNILVDQKNGSLVGIVDWECVQFVPIWKACRIPDFLQSPPRSEEPKYSSYQHNDDGTPGEGYIRHQREYESTVLRTVFLERMAQVDPSWIKLYEASGEKLDLCFCVESCDNSLCFEIIRKWLDNQAAGGEYYSLLNEAMQ